MDTKDFLRFIDTLSRRHDPYENEHAANSARLVKRLAEAIEYPASETENLILATRLHDVGKLLVSEHILNKQGKLTTEETAQIRRHVEIGYDTVSVLGFPPIVAKVVLEHHEHYDGTGYPRGLKGEAICLEARIVSICDAFDALTSRRAYRLAMAHKAAIEMIQKSNDFDPGLANLFVGMMEKQGDVSE